MQNRCIFTHALRFLIIKVKTKGSVVLFRTSFTHGPRDWSKDNRSRDQLQKTGSFHLKE